MSMDCTFYKHDNFRGTRRTHDLPSSWRYKWIRFGSALKNEITSIRARNHSGGPDAHMFAFTKRDFLGEYASLNVPNGWTCWWNHVGSSRNDDIESALLINRSNDEFVLGLTDVLADPFSTELAAALQGEDASPRGNPRIYGTFFPSWDPSRVFVTIEHDLRVDVPWWPDYDARLRYDIRFYVNSSNQVRAYVAWIHTWVEGGVFSGKILDQLHPQVVAGAPALNDALAGQLPLLDLLTAFRGGAQDVYLLPGREPDMPPPSSEFGVKGTAKEDCQLVISF